MMNSIYDETWDNSSFTFRNLLNLKTLPKNHLMKLETLQFDFVEYKAHQNLACHIYDRMNTHCLNQYGLYHDSVRTECMDIRAYLKQCKRLNQSYAMLRRYFPELFVESPYSRESVNPADILAGGVMSTQTALQKQGKQ